MEIDCIIDFMFGFIHRIPTRSILSQNKLLVFIFMLNIVSFCLLTEDPEIEIQKIRR